MEDTQHVGQIKETLTPSQTWAQRVSGSSHLGQTHQNKRTGDVSTENITRDNVEDREQLERIKKQHNVVISGVEEDDTKETARSLREKLQDIFTTYFDMTDVPVERAHRKRRNREDKPQIIICTIMDARKRQIILDNSSTCLQGIGIYINEDRTLSQQAEVRKKVAERKARLAKKTNKSEETNTPVQE